MAVRTYARTIRVASPMSPEDFSVWTEQVALKFSWSDAEISRRLGCGINQVRAWRSKGAPLYIGLACAAILAGIEPYRRPEVP